VSTLCEWLGGFYIALNTGWNLGTVRDLSWSTDEQTMKISALRLATCFALISTSTVSFAQNGKPSGQGAVTGDPAASSQNANPDTTGMSPSKSGSGTSTSGGRDANGDQGRDKMPESNMAVKSTPGKPDIPNLGKK
jgi:hypothetical protein